MEYEPTEGAIKAKEQQQDRPIFIIRAHHLFYAIKPTLKSGLPVSDLVNRYCGDLEKERASGHMSEKRQWYINDVLGSTQEQADKFRRYYTEFLEEFLQLPPDYPVKIVEDQKDKYCEGCAIGEYCSKRPILSWLGISADQIEIRDFKNTAKKLNLEDDLTVVEEIATYSNARPRTVKSIITTAGTVKKVLLSGPHSSLDI